jgi:tRNA dimethylallyltransferase
MNMIDSQAAQDRRAVALIAGPTASGKSALAMRLADHGPVTIINADSAQVYADLRILSARPGDADLTAAPHRLFGHIDGAEACSAARWAAEAAREIDAAHEHGRLPVLVGGTGLYIRTLLDGIAPVPDIAPAIRDAVRALPVAEAHAALSVEDPDAAARLAPADTTRVARALEVVRSTGRTLADWQRDRAGGIADRIRLAPLILLPPRPQLIASSDARFSDMVEAGAIAEVEALLNRRLSPSLPVMRAIGVREIAAFLDGSLSRAEMISTGQIATRQYAKRQYTWFSRQPPPLWPIEHAQLNNQNIDQIARKLYGNALTA